MKIDNQSLLAEVEGSESLEAIERTLKDSGLTLGLATIPSGTAGDWIASGAPGARDAWEDPADHLIAGLDAVMTTGALLSIRPAPRRSVGPDLVALFAAGQNRFGRITKLWLRVRRKAEKLAGVHPFVHERDPEITPEEKTLWDAIANELNHT